MILRLATCLACLATMAAETHLGLMGDRSGIHPASDPPIVWDYDGGYNILWHAPTPNFGYSAPTVVGRTVVVVCEPSAANPYPLVVGYDIDCGAEKWRQELNPLPLSVQDDTARAGIDATWRAWLRWREDFLLLREDYQRAGDKAALQPRFEQLGLKMSDDPKQNFGRKWPGKDDRLPDAPKGADWTIDTRALGAAGLSLDNWGKGYGGYYFGECFATPVSDGTAVYVQLAWSLWAAFDADGKRLWIRRVEAPLWGEYCNRGRSPLLWRDRLIADLANHVHAFDRKTGEVVWTFERKANGIGTHEMLSPIVVTIAGTDYLYSNCKPPTLIRLEDGKPFTIQGQKNCGIHAVGDPDRPDVIYACGGGEHGGWDKNEKEELPPLALRLSIDGDVARAERLWTGVDGQKYGNQLSWMVCHDGKLYFRDIVLDAATGKVLLGATEGRSKPQVMPRSTYVLAVVGGGERGPRIYGQGNAEHGSEKREDDLGARVECDVFDLHGHRLAQNILRGLPGQAQMRTRMHLPNWFNYANNFTVVGNRVFTRSCNEVICVGSLDDLDPAVVRGWGDPGDGLVAALLGDDAAKRQAAIVALKSGKDLPAAKLIELVALLTGDDPMKSSTAARAFAILGPRGGPAFDAVAATLAQVPQENDFLQRRLKWVMGAMGTAVEEQLTGMIDSGDEGQYHRAIQVASYMQDHDCATRLLARALITAKPPRFSPWLYPRESGQELTLRDIVTTALIHRARFSSAGAELLAAQLKPPNERDRGAVEGFMFSVRAIAPAKPELLESHLPTLRKFLRYQAGDARLGAALEGIGALGPRAKAALPDLEAWLEEERAKGDKADARLVGRIERAIAKVKG